VANLDQGGSGYSFKPVLQRPQNVQHVKEDANPSGGDRDPDRGWENEHHGGLYGFRERGSVPSRSTIS